MDTNQNKTKQDFDANIPDMFEINQMPEEKQKELVSKIGESIFDATLDRVLPLLNQDNLAAYEKLMDDKAEPDEMMDFFFDNVPDFFDILMEEGALFKHQADTVLSKIRS